MKILVVGGSNTAMRPGYVGDLSELLKTDASEEDSFEVHAIALGANACTMGLELLQGVDVTEYDVVCIEYFINDTLLLGALKNRPTWVGAYSGLHQLIRTASPKTKILNLILCRMRLRGSEEPMRRLVFDIANEFSASVLDIDAILRSSLPNEEFTKLYSNNSHYAHGAATARIAGLVARELLSLDSSSASSVNKKSDNRVSFEHAGVLSLHTELKGTRKSFKNSRYSINAACLRHGSPLAVTVPGSLISVSFLSVPATGSILISEDGETPVLVDTLHKDVIASRWKFLVQSVIFKDKSWSESPDALASARTVRFELVSAERRPELLRYLQPSSLTETELPEFEQEAYLIGCMYYRNEVDVSLVEEIPGLEFVSGKVFKYD